MNAITKIELKLEPVPMSTSGSGELFTFNKTVGTTLETVIDNYTVITTRDINDVISNQFLPVESDKMLTINDIGNGRQERLFMIPVRNIRWIKCYYN